VNEQARAAIVGWQQAVHATWARVTPPPSHEELLQRYQVGDDPRGLVPAFGAFGPTVTADERDALHALWPWEQADYFAVTTDASTQASGVFPGVGREGTGDNHRDAFRHAYWNSQLTEVLGVDKARELATLHETTPDATPRDHVVEAMDLHNNEVGRQLAQEHPGATPAEMSRLVQEAVQNGRMVVIDDTGRLVPSDYDFKPR
jgi:hypothetical protein